MALSTSGMEVEASDGPGPAYRLWGLYRYDKWDTGDERLPGPPGPAPEVEARRYRGLRNRIDLNSERPPTRRLRRRLDPRAPRNEERSSQRLAVAPSCPHLV